MYTPYTQLNDLKCQSVDGFYMMETVVVNGLNFIIYYLVSPNKGFRLATIVL